ncbi:MAG TPA: sigma-54 dependent transcriptional regulator [Catalimonadaceae bacterium]|nr:sigma-54 dependent transcriptional regulator [Catalimonadaceae bacterium]
MSYKIYIIEDDPWYGELLKYQLSMNPDYDVTLFSKAKDGLDSLYKKPDVVCIDYSLPDMTGEKLLQKIKAENNAIPVVVISGQEQISVAVNLLKAGASDYIIKDNNTKDLLWNAILKIRERADLQQEVEVLKEQLEQKFSFEKTILGQSPALKNVFSLVEKATRSNINVSITGETGTGKELVAKAIHFNSERKKKPFVAVNMAAIPKELLESELFGHEKGAFTGAIGQKAGKFEEAQGGTLFLDEIAEMDLSMQSKILRVLQEREVVRIGGNQTVKLDIRLLSATHKNLAEEVKKGTFREDLYYRLIGLPIDLPPLRLRGNDILILARHFVDEFCKDNKMKPVTFSADAKEKLMSYNFPGNVRELKALMDLAAVMSDGKEIRAEDITFSSLKSGDLFTTQEKSLRAYTCDIVTFFLKKYNNDVLEVARRLDIGKSTIYNMIKDKEITIG